MLHVKILHPRAPLPLKCRTIVNISKFASEAAYTSSKLSSLFKLKPSTLVYNSSCSQISSKKFFTSTVFKSIIKWNKKAIQLPSKDTIIYSYSTHLRKIAFLGALFQISFWMNLSHFCFTELQYEG